MRNKTVILQVAIGIIFSFILVNPSYATTYFVRTDGGTASQCTGTVDSPYPGSGTNQLCAFNHPFWVISPNGNNPTKMVGGDTLIIDGSNGVQYMIGFGAPNTSDTSKCSPSWAYDCTMRPVPSGPDPTHPTRILGKGWDTGCSSPPQLWGNERLWQVISLAGSNNVEVQCVEITDHSACQENGPNPCNRNTPPFGPWASIGIYGADSTNVLLKNVNIHGLAKEGIHAGRLKDWTLDNTKIVANSFAGWDGDIGAYNSSNSGTMTFNKVTIAYNGCGETYPGKQPYNCYSQDQGGYGDGLGTHYTGANWVFNNCDVSHNVSDGIDLLYHDGSGTVTIKRTRAEGNASNQIKSSTNTTIENSIIIGNCAYFKNNPITWQSSTFNNCRAMGNSVALNFHAGMNASITDSTITSNGDDLVLTMGNGCNGTEALKSRNNVFLGGPDFIGGDIAALYYASGATGNGDGTCGALPIDDDYSIIYGTKTFSTDCVGKPHSKCQDPKLVEPLVSYYTGNAYNANLQSTSPAMGAAVVIMGASSLDYNSYDRGNVWDTGALEYGSVPTTTSPTPSPNPVCGNGACESTESCSTCPTDCGICPPVCGNSKCESGETCSSCSIDCGVCPPVCGDGACNGTETCSTCSKDCGACCVSDGSCSAATPACGQTTTGVDNCGNACTKTGAVCTCVPTWCDALLPVCGTTTYGTDSCGKPCSKPSAQWPVACVQPTCTSDGSCSAATPTCGQTTTGVDNCGKACTKTGPVCPSPVCGNSKCESGETCSSCSVDCGICSSICGNRIVEPPEQCDDGNLINGDGCSSTCIKETAVPVCGNGIVEGREQCDDGNRNSGDGCSRRCRLEKH